MNLGKPEKPRLTIGFMPLTDCASVVMASELGLFRKYGLEVTLSRETSWAAVRDKLVHGQLDAAHALYGLIYGAQLGIGAPAADMAVLMGLNHDGQAITLSTQLIDAGITDGATLQRAVARRDRPYVFAHTFPTGTHAMWLYYWLAAHGIHPLKDVRAITVPPPQMVANLRAGQIDGYCAGEPWNARAEAEGVGRVAVATQAVWNHHPEKVLGTTLNFVRQYPATARALVAAVLEASIHVDDPARHDGIAGLLSRAHYIDAPAALIRGRMNEDCVRFHAGGEVNFPYRSHGIWFMTQQRRWGLLDAHPDYAAIAAQVNQTGLYAEVAGALGIAVPANVRRTETLFDGTVFDPARAAAYADGFDLKA